MAAKPWVLWPIQVRRTTSPTWGTPDTTGLAENYPPHTWEVFP
eukprot:CAMPEP_0204158744 /NCGR_PEP_ID=MMETSP0361-20130328/32378_1 /ASSEMBLY_ACC=CAM_ASM_000343 /TAXON_ID=268821 /ORGANISM="Scrippsiella Hangoei, Strain SHTV-5" /LENGTH=42 /DNA_ID= /DNA_START= /DNA_END= /DNA_ORIENTATION=